MCQHIRDAGPEHHQKKEGTPTMGGILVLIVITVSTLLWCDLHNGAIWVALLAQIGRAHV